MVKFPRKLEAKLLRRKEEGLFRSLPQSLGRVDFTSNDYLGLARDPTIFLGANQHLDKKGLASSGSTGSRLLSGNHAPYAELEETLAKFHDAPSALVFNSGYDANTAFFSSIPQRGDVVFFDELIHASIRDGIKLGNSKGYKFRHNDLEDLKNKCLAKHHQRTNTTEIYVVTESVFSMDGDSPDLKELSKFCSQYGFHLIVDEAHANGIFGTKGMGKVMELGLQTKVFARIVTFGKALGCHGAAVLGGTALKDYLVNFARSLIYTTALPPHSIAVVLKAYDLLLSSHGTHSRNALLENIKHFNRMIKAYGLSSFFIPSHSAIHSCIVSGNHEAKSAASAMQKAGFDVRPILSPTVPKGKERLRFCLHSYNSTEEIEDALATLSRKLSTDG